MRAKENALRIVHFDSPEHVMTEPPAYRLCYHGCNHEGLAEDLGDDHPIGSKWSDIWGVEWHKVHEGVMGLPKGNPLANTRNLAGFRWPDPNDERICGKIYQMARTFDGTDRFLGGFHRDTLWEKAYMLVGMENMMIYFHTEPAFVREVLHRIMDFQLGVAEHYTRLGVELAYLGDDLGTQQGPLLGPKIVKEFLVPEYERLFQFYKERGVLIWFHSCGNVESMIDTFIHLGVDILNPIQSTANDLAKLRSMTEGKMALHGGVSSATIMDGPVGRIFAEVRERIWQLGKTGGYFCWMDQRLPFPKSHLDALNMAVQTYGCYPVSAPGQ